MLVLGSKIDSSISIDLLLFALGPASFEQESPRSNSDCDSAQAEHS